MTRLPPALVDRLPPIAHEPREPRSSGMKKPASSAACCTICNGVPAFTVMVADAVSISSTPPCAQATTPPIPRWVARPHTDRSVLLAARPARRTARKCASLQQHRLCPPAARPQVAEAARAYSSPFRYAPGCPPRSAQSRCLALRAAPQTAPAQDRLPAQACRARRPCCLPPYLFFSFRCVARKLAANPVLHSLAVARRRSCGGPHAVISNCFSRRLPVCFHRRRDECSRQRRGCIGGGSNKRRPYPAPTVVPVSRGEPCLEKRHEIHTANRPQKLRNDLRGFAPGTFVTRSNLIWRDIRKPADRAGATGRTRLPNRVLGTNVDLQARVFGDQP